MYKTIKNYFEYYPAVAEEAVWGFQVTAAGHTRFGQGEPYPAARHPAGHHFTWEKGRMLAAALQVVAIRNGGGSFEWRRGRRAVGAGDCFLLIPGCWHRYRPDSATGWTEDWFELRGKVLGELALDDWAENPVTSIPLESGFWLRFDEFHQVCRQRAPGCRGVSAGLAHALLAEILAASASRRRPWDGIESGFYAAARKRLLDGIPIPDIARDLGLSYPSFHRKFKEATRLAPKEYRASVRHSQAEDLLRDGHLSIKEIAARLGFYSASHFSVEFKKRAHISPTEWRRPEGRNPLGTT